MLASQSAIFKAMFEVGFYFADFSSPVRKGKFVVALKVVHTVVHNKFPDLCDSAVRNAGCKQASGQDLSD